MAAEQYTDGSPVVLAEHVDLTRYGSEEEAFQRAIDENPLEATNHLVFADWLQEQGQDDEAAFRRAMGEWFQHEQYKPGPGKESVVGVIPNTNKVAWSYHPQETYSWTVHQDDLPGGVENNDIERVGYLMGNGDQYLHRHPSDVQQHHAMGTDNNLRMAWQSYRGMEEAFRRAFMTNLERQRQQPPTDASRYAAQSQAGGTQIGGKQYRGGQFIPADVMARSSPVERAAVQSGQSRNKPVMPTTGISAPRRGKYAAGTQGMDGMPLPYGPKEEEQAFQRAIDENPLDSVIHLVFADWLQEQGQDDEAMFRRAMGEWWQRRQEQGDQVYHPPPDDYPSTLRLNQWRFNFHEKGAPGISDEQARWVVSGVPSVNFLFKPEAPHVGQGTSWGWTGWHNYRDMEEAFRQGFFKRKEWEQRRQQEETPDEQNARYAKHRRYTGLKKYSYWKVPPGASFSGVPTAGHVKVHEHRPVRNPRSGQWEWSRALNEMGNYATKGDAEESLGDRVHHEDLVREIALTPEEVWAHTDGKEGTPPPAPEQDWMPSQDIPPEFMSRYADVQDETGNPIQPDTSRSVETQLQFHSPQAFVDSYMAGLHPQTHPDDHQRHHRAVNAFVGSLPQTAFQRLSQGRLDKLVHYHNPDHLRDTFHELQRRDYPDEQPGGNPAAFFDMDTKSTHINGGDIDGNLTHEMGHALDWSGDLEQPYLSDSDEFRYAWSQEIKNGNLSRYAATDEIEGFAEFSRLLYGTPGGIAIAQEEFPLTFAFFRKQGLV